LIDDGWGVEGMPIGPTKIELTICNKCDYFIEDYIKGYFVVMCNHSIYDKNPKYIQDASCRYTETRDWCPCLGELKNE
jgi:hypothetical protein